MYMPVWLQAGFYSIGADNMIAALIIFIILLAAAFAALVFRSAWERKQLSLERYFVDMRRDDPVRTDPEGGHIKFAFLSDLHDYCRDNGTDKIITVLEKEQPAMVLLGGDMFTCMKHREWAADVGPSLDLIRELAKRWAVVYAEGNHEARLRDRHPDSFEAYSRALEQEGVICLRNRSVVLNGVAIHGITMEEDYYRRLIPLFGKKKPMPQDYILKKLGMPQKDKINILMMHSPMYLEEAAAWGADLVLSGHFHGGTIRLPLPGRPGLMTPQFQFFVKECSGMHTSGNGRTKMIVSRGIGTHSVDIRFNDLPEISMIEMNFS